MAVDPFTLLAASSIAAIGKPAPTTSAGGTVFSPFDSSGWNVNFGSGTISSSAQKSQGGMGSGAASPGYASAAGAGTDVITAYMPYILLGLGGIVVWKLLSKRR